MTTKAINDVLIERARQINVEGWTPEHDDHHIDGALSKAAACYALCAGIGVAAAEGAEMHYEFVDEYQEAECPAEIWPFDPSWWKPKNPRRDLVRAATLIIAEIERIDRAAERATELPPEVASRYPNDVMNEAPPDDGDEECADCLAHPAGSCDEHSVENLGF